jgi:hypothetical protein
VVTDDGACFSKQHTTSARTAMSLRPSIQKAHEAIQRSPRWAAKGSTCSCKILLSTGPPSLSCTRVIAMASCRSLSWWRQTSTAPSKLSANRKNAAAYATESSRQPNVIPPMLERALTKSSLAEERIRILQRRALPLGVLKVVGQQLLRHGLLLIPACHAPQAL